LQILNHGDNRFGAGFIGVEDMLSVYARKPYGSVLSHGQKYFIVLISPVALTFVRYNS
jgi:hypothetical protein